MPENNTITFIPRAKHPPRDKGTSKWYLHEVLKGNRTRKLTTKSDTETLFISSMSLKNFT